MRAQRQNVHTVHIVKYNRFIMVFTTYSPSHLVQITVYWEFLHECCKEKSLTFIVFLTNLVLARNIKIIC